MKPRFKYANVMFIGLGVIPGLLFALKMFLSTYYHTSELTNIIIMTICVVGTIATFLAMWGWSGNERIPYAMVFYWIASAVIPVAIFFYLPTNFNNSPLLLQCMLYNGVYNGATIAICLFALLHTN